MTNKDFRLILNNIRLFRVPGMLRGECRAIAKGKIIDDKKDMFNLSSSGIGIPKPLLQVQSN